MAFFFYIVQREANSSLTFGGKKKLLSLGTYPETRLKDARTKRDEARQLLADAIDPAENRKVKKQARADLAANSYQPNAPIFASKTITTNKNRRIIAGIKNV